MLETQYSKFQFLVTFEEFLLRTIILTIIRNLYKDM